MNCLVYAVDLWLDSNSWVTAGNIQSERDYHEPKNNNNNYNKHNNNNNAEI